MVSASASRCGMYLLLEVFAPSVSPGLFFDDIVLEPAGVGAAWVGVVLHELPASLVGMSRLL